MPIVFPKHLVCHCLLIETAQNLILVDTGIGFHEVGKSDKFMSPLLGIEERPELTALAQVKKAGFSPADVSDIVVTHLDMDHAGGISDFKNARTHVSQRELDDARDTKSSFSKVRYRAFDFKAAASWQPFVEGYGEKWNGFDCVRELKGLPSELLLIDLPGHTAGHFGVAIQSGANWLLHAGDSYYDHRELKAINTAPLGFKLFERAAHKNYDQALATQKSLKDLRTNKNVNFFCSHDPIELANFV